MTYIEPNIGGLARLDDVLKKLRGARVGVWGLGVAGKAMARYLKAQGATVVGLDDNTRWEDQDFSREMGSSLELVLGPLKVELLKDLDLLVLSPGVDSRNPVVQELHTRGLSIVGELELLGALPSRVCALTGTNGKSTTTALIGVIAQHLGASVFVGGNLGTPIAEWVTSGEKVDVAILELSSYQLETAYRFVPQVGIVLNVTPDHTERYDHHEDYARTKRRLIENLTQADTAILNYDDECVREMVSVTKASVWWFSTQSTLTGMDGVYLEGDTLKGSGKFASYPDIELSHPRLWGEHNRQNALAAFLASDALGLNADQDWKKVLLGYRTFDGLEHRLELVANDNGVRYVNDSKATNDSAAAVAIRAIERPIILLAGGRGKGAGYSDILAASVDRVRHVVAFGESRDEIADVFYEHKENIGAGVSRRVSLEEAFREASFLALPGDVVLLAPACSSFDQFSSYVERGLAFKKLVKSSLSEVL